MNILVIPDGHAHPDFDNNRFTALGKYIHKTRPDVVVCIGDLADMPSLSSYDKGTKGFEGRRYKRDIESVIDAQEKLFEVINKYNKRQIKHKGKQYKPRLVMCVGKHEDRINRVVNHSSELDGTIGLFDLKYEEFGWEVIPFHTSIEIAGINFSHYFSSGISGRPISGEHIGASLCNKLHASAVQGHSHLFNHAERTRPDGMKIFGLSVGCFSHPEQIEGWNKNTQHLWWMGIVELLDCDGEGYYDQLKATTTRKLERDYGA